MKITYERAYDQGLRHEITEARYKGVTMKLDIWVDMVFIHGMESTNEGKGECQEMIAILKEDFKAKRFGSSPPVSEASKHIFDKMGVNYKDYMKETNSTPDSFCVCLIAAALPEKLFPDSMICQILKIGK